MSSTARLPTYSKELLLNSPTPVKLPIAERVVHEVLLSQPRTRMSSRELAAIFSPRDAAERQRLTLAIARVGRLSYTAAGEGIVSLRRAEGAAAAAAPAHKVAPLALKPEAVR